MAEAPEVKQVGWFLSKGGSTPAFHTMDTLLPTRPGWTIEPAFAPVDSVLFAPAAGLED